MVRRRQFTVRSLFAITVVMAVVLALYRVMSPTLAVALAFVAMMFLQILGKIDDAALDALRNPEQRSRVNSDDD